MGSMFCKQEEKPKQSVEDAAVAAFVKGLVKDANLTAVPDAIEMRLYTNVVKVALAFLMQAVKGASIDFMNHRITFKIEPIIGAATR